MGKWTRRGLLAGAGVAIGAYGANRLHASKVPFASRFPATVGTTGTILNDAGELSPTTVAKHVTLTGNPDDALLTALRAELAEAKAAGRGLVAHSARHSMGGQSLLANGTAITLDQPFIEPNVAAKTYRVAAGTRWSTVIRELDKIVFHRRSCNRTMISASHRPTASTPMAGRSPFQEGARQSAR